MAKNAAKPKSLLIDVQAKSKKGTLPMAILNLDWTAKMCFFLLTFQYS